MWLKKRTDWKSYKHPEYDEAESIDIAGRRGHLVSNRGDAKKTAHISVGDGWFLYKKLNPEKARGAVEKVLLYLSSILKNRYSDPAKDSYDELGEWFENQFK